MNSEKFNVDSDYIIAMRRELHQHPELSFDLPQTLALVRRELGKMGIPYTEKFGRSSIVATINEKKANFTIGIRADMDALPVQEKIDWPFKSQTEGKMHACGHDAHTAILLGTVKALNEIRDQIGCRVKFLFQPSEEGQQSGAELMVRDGVMDDIDMVIGQHVANELETGTIAVCPGMSMPASRTVKLIFHGKSAHATLPHTGVDALAMAFRAYGSIQLMLARELNPLERFVCAFNKMQAGTTQNVIADYAELLGTIRSYDVAVDQFIFRRIEAIAQSTARDIGGQAEVISSLKAIPVYNDPLLSDCLIKTAAGVVGPDKALGYAPKMGSEDFSQYLTRKPGVFFRLGTRDRDHEPVGSPHNSDFWINEQALAVGCRVFVQFVLDHMDGIPGLVQSDALKAWPQP